MGDAIHDALTPYMPYVLALLFLGGGANAAKPPAGDAERELRYGLARARSYIRTELRKPYPNLEDEWLRWIVALGLSGDVAAWGRRQPAYASVLPDPAACSAMGRWSGGTISAAAEGWAADFLGTPHS